jgi:hypothetical protein
MKKIILSTTLCLALVGLMLPTIIMAQSDNPTAENNSANTETVTSEAEGHASSPQLEKEKTSKQPTALKLKAVNVRAFSGVLKKGEKSEEIKDLQSILKEDPTIYPEGLVTGYFGRLTEKAIKRLQQKYGIPETGVVDENTKKILYPPKVALKIISPNGGEVWDKSEPHLIQWQAIINPIVVEGRELVPQTTIEPGQKKMPEIMPFFPRATLTLIKDSSLPNNFRYHIATVNLYQAQYRWRIPAGIPNGDDYKVEIRMGRHVPCAYRLEKDTSTGDSASIIPRRCLTTVYPIYSASDTSDKPFTITGTTPPPNDIIRKLKILVGEMAVTAEKLIGQIREMKELLGSL